MTEEVRESATPRRLPGAVRAAGFTEPEADSPSSLIRRRASAPENAAHSDGHRREADSATTLTAPPNPQQERLATPANVTPTPPSVPLVPGQGTGAATGWGRFEGPVTDSNRTVVPVHPVGGWVPPPVQEKPAEWGRKRMWIRVGTLGMAKAKPGAEERAHREAVRQIRQLGWPRCVRVLIANPKGGSAKTPTALTLAGAISDIKGAGVVVWDASQSPGDLAARGEGRQAMCLSDVAANPQGFDRPGAMAVAVAGQSSYADVLGTLRRDRHLDAALVQRVQWALDRSYRISIADSGANETRRDPGGAFRELIDTADQLVIPVIPTKASVDAALGLLDEYSRTEIGRGALIAVVNYGGPTTVGLSEVIDRLFVERGVPVEHMYRIPYDPAIAAGTTITYSDLSHRSKVAWTRLAAAALRNIVVRPGRNMS